MGLQKSFSADTVNGAEIRGNEMSAVYLYRDDVKIENLTIQASEVSVSKVYWAEIDELLSVMKRGSVNHCINIDELYKIKKMVF
ncbi:MAG: hypothetical protein LUG26_06535 [Ruminococcus sp.]|nr:hypothetical protein [Ruminococcus sp.]